MSRVEEMGKPTRGEILAPVGGEAQLLAAVRCGADAVYLGAGQFQARQRAESFSGDALRQAVAYCHGRGVKVHVTVNTLVLDSELDALEAELRAIAESGADAVIVQDLAVLELLRRCCPDLERHASTQMTVHNVEGARMMQDLGFQRVVLARELSLEEIRRITQAVDIETEVFVHGAHCMSMSGSCYLSSVLGGRSGNRGRCAQPCRLDFRCGERHFALSLKDMSNLRYVPALIEAGVASFKIEGRLKRPEYVAAAVTACRQARAGEPYDEGQLQAVFSRAGFTDGYMSGRRGADMFGHRRKEDVTAAEGVLGDLAALYRKEMPRLGVEMDFRMEAHAASLSVRCGEETVTVSGPAPQAARTQPTDAESAERALTKTGGTPFCVARFRADICGGGMLPASALNAMRREALDALLRRREETPPHIFIEGEAPVRVSYVSPERPRLRARCQTAAQAEACAGAAEEIILPVAEIEKNPHLIEALGPHLLGEMPPLVFPGEEEALQARMEALRRAGLQAAVAENWYGLRLGRRLGFAVHGGHGLNLVNTPALAVCRELGLESATISFELPLRALRRLGDSLRRGILLYGHLPLMRFRACPVKGRDGCGHCSGRSVLIDRMQRRFTVLCADRRYGSLLNPVLLYVGDKELPKLDFLTAYFTTESPGEAAEILRLCRLGAAFPGEHTGGLYYKTLL